MDKYWTFLKFLWMFWSKYFLQIQIHGFLIQNQEENLKLWIQRIRNTEICLGSSYWRRKNESKTNNPFAPANQYIPNTIFPHIKGQLSVWWTHRCLLQLAHGQVKKKCSVHKRQFINQIIANQHRPIFCLICDLKVCGKYGGETRDIQEWARRLWDRQLQACKKGV